MLAPFVAMLTPRKRKAMRKDSPCQVPLWPRLRGLGKYGLGCGNPAGIRGTKLGL